MSEQEPQEETKLTLKSLKKEFDDFKKYLETRLPAQPLPPIHGVAPIADPKDVKIPEKEAENAIVFHFHDRFTSSRAFSQENNGENWRELANTFHQNNITQIKKREDLQFFPALPKQCMSWGSE